MKRIDAYIQEFMLQHVIRELQTVHLPGITVSNVRGFGREKDESYPHHAADYAVDFTPKVKLEILCSDEQVRAFVDAILRGAHTGRKGDGKVFVSPVEEVFSIRDHQAGDGAI